MSILNDSLYYPASGFDGDPVMRLMGNVYSFIYVDYAFTEEDQKAELNQHPFLGYELIGARHVAEAELSPNGYTLIPVQPGDGNPELPWRGGLVKPPFARWMVFERSESVDESHNPKRFSLIHLSADGVAAYQALYTSNGTKPKVLAIIQQGSTGGNWTDFRDPKKILARAAHRNPSGLPKYLLCGCWCGPRDLEEEYCKNPIWPDYPSLVTSFRTDHHFLALWEQSG
jgi:hypothetical protein